MHVEIIKTDNVYFWSDWHHSHSKEFLYAPRGFSSVQEHDRVLLERYQAKVPRDAIVYLLGDIIFGQDAEARLEELLRTLNGSVISLLPGNHVSGFRSLKQKYGFEWAVSDSKIVRFLSNYEEIRVAGQPIVLSHYPLISWNGMGRGSFHCFGHVHGRIEQGRPDGVGFGKMLDVGVDSCASPVSLSEVKEIMARKPPSNIDHHGEDTKNPF